MSKLSNTHVTNHVLFGQVGSQDSRSVHRQAADARPASMLPADSSRVITSGPCEKTQQRFAFICVALALILGAFTFEIASGADPNVSGESWPPPSLIDSMTRREMVHSMMTSNMDGLLRIEQNRLVAERLAASDNEAPKSATETLIERSIVSDIRLKTPDALAVDPVLGLMPVASWITKTAYRELDRRYKTVGLRRVTDNRIALDMARQSAIPGLMRMLTRLDAPNATHSKDGQASTSAREGAIDQANAARMIPSVASTADGAGISVTSGSLAEPVRDFHSLSKAEKTKSPSVQGLVAVETEPLDKNMTRIESRKQKSISQSYKLEASAPIVVVNEPLDFDATETIKTTAQSSRPSVSSPAPQTPAPQAPVPPASVVATPIAPSPMEPSVRTPKAPTSKVPASRTPEQPVANQPVASQPVASQPVVPSEIAPAPARSVNTTVSTQPTLSQGSAKQHGNLQNRIAEPVRNDAPELAGPDAKVAAKWPFTQTASAAPAAQAQTVSLNVNNTDVRSVLEMLARGYGMNILVSPDVNGVVNANIEGLSPDQTLQGVLKMCDLQAQVDQGVIYVYSADKMPDDARVVRHFTLDYARAETIEPAVQGLLSPIGNAYVNKLDATDNRNTEEAIVVVDTAISLARIENFLMQADRPPRQVMIEARVLEIELSDDMKHGVDFSGLVGGDIQVGALGLADGAASAANPLFFAQFDGTRVDALIDSLETTTDAKTLATPRVMVLNGQNARIQVGQQLGFTVATVTQTSTVQDVQFLETGVVLSVTPTISRDNQIMMQVKPEVSSGQINPTTLLPEEETRELETSVLLNNHQGVVIGGLIQENDRTVIRKLPWLGDVKHVGKLFQRREEVRSRSEIVIALVPHIIELEEHPERTNFGHERWRTDYERTNGPLLYGPLQRSCRPWEPKMPDSMRQSPHMDVNKINRMIP